MLALEPQCTKNRLFRDLDFFSHRKLVGEKWLVPTEQPWANEGNQKVFLPNN